MSGEDFDGFFGEPKQTQNFRVFGNLPFRSGGKKKIGDKLLNYLDLLGSC